MDPSNVCSSLFTKKSTDSSGAVEPVMPEVKNAVDLLQLLQTNARVELSPSAKVWRGSSHRYSFDFFLNRYIIQG